MISTRTHYSELSCHELYKHDVTIPKFLHLQDALYTYATKKIPFQYFVTVTKCIRRVLISRKRSIHNS